VFPLEMRALSISIFYAVGTGVGGFAAPALFGALIATGSRGNVFMGYAVGAALVLVAAAIAWRHAVDAERKPLELVAPPLGAAHAEDRGA
jgi:dipeptide/tripeptide permease